MTQRLFFTDDNLTTELEVVDCTPHENQFAVILRSTIFHPQGGGQPCDTGWLGNSQVLRVLQEQDLIVHYVDQALTPGLVQARVDAQHRALHTRLHSAGHLIGNVGETLGWMPIKAHHWPGEGRITFIAGESAQTMESGLIQATVNQWIDENLPRKIAVSDGMREVGFGHLPAYPCGGTHVRRLQELGTVKIASLSQKKGTLSVHYSVD